MMDGAGEHRWSRSRYPLQAPGLGSGQNPVAPPSEEANNSSWDRLPTKTLGVNSPVSEYRAVNDGNSSSHQPTEVVKAPDASFAPISRSQRSTSLLSTSDESQLRSGEGEGSSFSIQVPRDSQNEASRSLSPWARNAYPLQATIKISPAPHQPTPTSIGEHEQLPVQVSKTGQNTATKRSLRRTQRSQRLNQTAAEPSVKASSQGSPTTPIGADEVWPSINTPENKQNAIATGAGTHNRHACPVHSSTNDSMMQHQVETYSGQLSESGEAFTDTTSWDRQAYPMQPPTRGSTAPPASPPLSESESSAVNKTTTHQFRESNEAANENKPRGRRAYPLQAPASNANLRHSPTPPSSPEREPEQASGLPPNQSRDNDKAAVQVHGLRRQVYPLQSPASVANLQRSQTPPPSPEGEPENNYVLPTEHVRENSDPARRTITLRRQDYPLQSPASVPALRHSSLPAPSLGRELRIEGKSSANQARENELARKVISHWRRQAYPVQSPENIARFQRFPTPQPPEIETAKDHRPDPIHLPKNIRAVTDAEKHDAKGRTIIVCLDGTGDKFDNDNSNIVHLISVLKKDDPHQVSYYQAGIGTYGSGGLSSGVSAALDMAVGSGLGLHVRDAYHFLMHSYKEGDKICIFGFSRGAYTARCLAGMIHKVGLLPPRNIQQIPFAYEFYANNTTDGWKQSEDFKATFCIDVCVYFLGCFDSVASVGFIPRQLPLSSTPTSKARYFRHAMALDERRAKFKICRHQTKDWDDIREPGSQKDDARKESGKANHPNVTDEEYQRLTAQDEFFDTDVLEVWFVGAHADVGGGAVSNDERHKLAQIPLRWMIRQAFECDTGIIFKTKILAEFGLDVHTLWPEYERLSVPAHGPPPSYLEKYDKALPPKSIRRSKLVATDKHEKGEQLYHLKSPKDEDWTPEQVEDFYDVMSPMNDQLIQAPTWWILEFWPVQYEVPTTPGEVSVRTGMNLGRYRGVSDFEPNLHWTVRHRVQHMGYKVQARTAAHTTWRTVV